MKRDEYKLKSVFVEIRMKFGDSNKLFFAYFLKGHRDSEVFQEVVQHSCCPFEVIFLNRMTDIMQNSEFELPLHLRNGKLFVHSFFLGCYKYFWNVNT